MSARGLHFLGLITFMLVSDLVGQIFEVHELSEFDLLDQTGVSVADFDLDGDLDFFIVSAPVFDSINIATWSRLFENNGDNQFVDVTFEAGLINLNAATKDGTIGSKMGSSWGDFNSDGYPDLFLANYGKDELWRNEGDGTFTEIAHSANVEGCDFCYSTNGLWWDFDSDDDLDLYVSDWRKRNRLYRNDGNEVFEDVSSISGMDLRDHTFTSVPMDLNKDGLMDLYIINDATNNLFFRNLDGISFIEETEKVGLENIGNGMGVSICDVNKDGLFDLYVTNIHKFVPNPFFIGSPQGTFENLSAQYGLEDTGWGWGARFFDVDHDLDEDIYVVNGFDSPVGEGDRNKFFLNEDNLFTEVASLYDLDNENIGMGLETFDSDGDGDLDMLVGVRGNHPIFYENTLSADEASSWLKVNLLGSQNSTPIGSAVEVVCGPDHLFRYYSGVNIFGQSLQPLHFGLGNHSVIDQVVVTWPDRSRESYGPFSSRQKVIIHKGNGEKLEPDFLLNIDLYNLDIYPNPFDNSLFIEGIDMKGSVLIQINDLSGRIVYSTYFDPFQNPLKIRPIGIKSGIYSLSIMSPRIKKTFRVIKK